MNGKNNWILVIDFNYIGKVKGFLRKNGPVSSANRPRMEGNQIGFFLIDDAFDENEVYKTEFPSYNLSCELS